MNRPVTDFSNEAKIGRAAYPAGRSGVSLLFAINGFVTGSWAPKIPEFAGRLNLSESDLGVMIVVFGVGSLLAMPMVGALIARNGSHSIVRLLAIATAVSLLLVTLAPGPIAAAAMLALFGASIGGMDVAMNANAVAVERRLGRAIMSSCHGFWSLGGLIGAAAGGLAIETLGAIGHALAVTAFALTALALAWNSLHDDRTRTKAVAPRSPRPGPGLFLTPLPWLIGIMALCSMVPEGAVLDWSALYFRQELGAGLAYSGLAFAAFSATMAAMRFAGDGLRNRMGAVATLRIFTLVAGVGMFIASQASTPGLATAGFALCGIGIANLVPIAFSAAGNLPGLAPGVGLAIATSLGYSGILLAPSLIGFVAEHTGFRPVFAALPMLLLVVLSLSRLAYYADSESLDGDA